MCRFPGIASVAGAEMEPPMFPLAWPRRQYLVMIATPLFFAVSVPFVPRRRIAFLLPAFALSTWCLERSIPDDDLAGLVLLLTIAALLVLTGLAMGFSGVLRLVGVPRATSVAVMCLAVTAVAALTLRYR